MTVAEVMEMGNDEFVGWYVYLGKKAQKAEVRQQAKQKKGGGQ